MIDRTDPNNGQNHECIDGRNHECIDGRNHEYAGGDTPVPDTPAGRQLRALLDAFNMGTGPATRRFLDEAYDNRFRPLHTAELRFWLDGTLYRLSGGLTPARIVVSTGREIAIVAQARQTALQMLVTLWVAADAPHRITLAEAWPVPHPADALAGVHGHRLAVAHGGAGAPTVVFEGGLGCARDVWDWVADGVARFARVCRYDRAGLGESEPAPGPRTCREAVADLRALLHTEQVPGPYVLVGHAFGSFIARSYAGQYPDDVAGLVLIDPDHPNLWERLAAVLPPWEAGEHAALAELRRQVTADVSDPSANVESMDMLASAAQARATTLRPDLPMTILARGTGHCPCLPDFTGDRARETCLHDLPREIGARVSGVYADLCHDALHLSSQGQLVIAERSEHLIQLEQPDLVIDAIRDVVERSRA